MESWLVIYTHDSPVEYTWNRPRQTVVHDVKQSQFCQAASQAANARWNRPNKIIEKHREVAQLR